jgi:hypothetical protein
MKRPRGAGSAPESGQVSQMWMQKREMAGRGANLPNLRLIPCLLASTSHTRPRMIYTPSHFSPHIANPALLDTREKVTSDNADTRPIRGDNGLLATPSKSPLPPPSTAAERTPG